MIDLHSHILPGIDDGPMTMEKSLELADSYQRAGFTTIVATPHWVPGTTWTPSIENIYQRRSLLQDSCKSKNINIKICVGMEIALDVNLGDLLLQKRLLTLAGSPYILIESPFQRLPIGWDQMFFSIMANGYRIILAHPERCMHLLSSPDLYDDIIGSGVYFQVNYDSFLGNYGKEISETAFYLLKKGYIHFLATDSHDPIQRHPGNARKTLEVLAKIIDAKTIENLTKINPEHVIKGIPLEGKGLINFLPKNRKRWWWF
jgi:protein-tyrosine phosphatase